MAFGQGGSEWARFLSTGSFGIGTTNPSDKLHVLGGNIRVDSATGAVNFWSGAGYYGGIGIAGGLGGSGTDIVIRADSTRSIIFFTGGANDRGRFDASGNLLVATTTATGTASQALQVNSGAYVSGNLGIGTTNPSFALDVNGIGRFTNSFADVRLLNNYSASAQGYRFALDGGSPNNLYLQRTTNNFSSIANILVVDSSGNLIINNTSATGTASQPLQVTGGAYVSGSVGIGTTNPTSKLSVVGDVSVSGVVTATTFSGNASTATTLQTTRTIWGQNFNGGANVSGALSGATTITTSSDINIGGELNFNSANNKYIDFYTTNDVTSYTAYLRLVNDASNSFHQAIDMTRGGAVTLYHNNVAKFGTTSGGVSVTGSVTASTQLISSVATGTAPLTVSSTTKVTNLNADLLDGIDSTSFLRSDTTTTWSGSAGGIFQVTLPASASGANTGQVNTLQLYQGTSNADAFLTFHVGGDYAAHFGLDGTTNDLFYGGWSVGAVKNKVWHQGNDGSGSGLDADLLDGLNSATANTVSTIVARDASGNFSAGTITASLTGNSSTTYGCTFANDAVNKADITTRTDSGFYEHDTATTAEGWPITSNTWMHMIACTHSNDTNYYSMQIAASFFNNTDLYYRSTNGSGTTAWSKIWNSSNDGSGSGLDADLLDGYESATANTVSTIVARDASGNFSAGTITASLTGAASLNVLKAGDTMTGQLISTLANSTTTGGGQIYLNGATGNRIDFNTNGVTAPTFTTRSVGTKIVLYPTLDASNVDYAFGIESSTLWSSVPSSSAQFKWYAGTTNIATLSGTGTLSATQFTSLSDINKKKNIRPIENAIDITKKLEGVRFDWIDNDTPSIGVIAQEVEKVLPELVEETDGVKSVSYGNIVGVLIEAIKEQQIRIEELERKLNA